MFIKVTLPAFHLHHILLDNVYVLYECVYWAWIAREIRGNLDWSCFHKPQDLLPLYLCHLSLYQSNLLFHVFIAFIFFFTLTIFMLLVH
jgi:hypothetical protein